MPSDDDLAGIVITCDTVSYPSSADEGTTVFSGNASDISATASGLTNDTAYRCTAFTFDNGDNFSSGALTTCTPSASQPSGDSETASEETTSETTPEEATPSDETSTEETPDSETSGEETSGDTTPGEETSGDEISEKEATEGGGESGESAASGEALPEGVPTGPEVSGVEGTSSDEISFYGDDGTMELTVDDGTVDVIAGNH